MDEHVELFLADVLALEGEKPEAISVPSGHRHHRMFFRINHILKTGDLTRFLVNNLRARREAVGRSEQGERVRTSRAIGVRG
jgi:hypothetical protein